MSTTEPKATSPGRAHLIATGRPADGSQSEGQDSAQHLVNPRTHNPTSRSEVHAWIQRRVAADAQMRAAREARR